jgi:hypothetical protein
MRHALRDQQYDFMKLSRNKSVHGAVALLAEKAAMARFLLKWDTVPVQTGSSLFIIGV